MDLHDAPPIRIDPWFQGPTGLGQGGWTANRFVQQIGATASVSIAAPIPLETDLHVAREAERWQLRAGSRDGVTVMSATDTATTFADTTAVSIEEAASARRRFARHGHAHPVPWCFSCGSRPDAMGVHAAGLGTSDDRFATDWTVPTWAAQPDGSVDEGVMWAALDCTAAWYVCRSRGDRTAFTVQFAAEVIHPIEPGGTYALVGWPGDESPEWDGRKRHGASAAFAADGTCVARSASFWVAVDA